MEAGLTASASLEIVGESKTKRENTFCKLEKLKVLQKYETERAAKSDKRNSAETTETKHEKYELESKGKKSLMHFIQIFL